MKRIQGVEIMLTRRELYSLPDEMNEQTPIDPPAETIADVIVTDGGQANAGETERPLGVDTARTIYLPRAWEWRSLKGATVTIDGTRYRVVGDPHPVRTNLTPTRHWPVAVQVSTQEA
ncbi:hypothetical protein BW14_05020 [Bifidobacterium sp. UTBIF-68]|uniref:hypothetical protein n=1 Tax=Bifidobacterium sp. UTBIF-68 TaxID=1465262 RepID=UPI00112921D0|nr:hypothetical protein [Bifidobacterium sp. UTBIF-68]TPF93623.1 hypothetical protein BW14_05020 [Bifidobacterium sp. UTBIF-68]